jgi:protein involved in sex pheromone biosynthesis
MKTSVFIENCAKFFTDDEQTFANVPAEVIKDKDGVIQEIRIINEEYSQMLIIGKDGKAFALDMEEFRDQLDKNPKTKGIV